MNKKSVFVTVLLVTILSFIPVFAATTSTLSVAGFIGEPPGDLSLDLTRTPEQQEPIDLTLGATQKSVATLEADSNGPRYKISVTSTNGFDLVHGSSSTAVPYTLNITGGATWNNNPSWPSAGQTVDFEHDGVGNKFYDLAVTTTAVNPASFPVGNYTDTLTMTIRVQD